MQTDRPTDGWTDMEWIGQILWSVPLTIQTNCNKSLIKFANAVPECVSDRWNTRYVREGRGRGGTDIICKTNIARYLWWIITLKSYSQQHSGNKGYLFAPICWLNILVNMTISNITLSSECTVEFVVCMHRSFVSWFFSLLLWNWLFVCFAGWSVGWMDGWLVGWLA